MRRGRESRQGHGCEMTYIMAARGSSAHASSSSCSSRKHCVNGRVRAPQVGGLSSIKSSKPLGPGWAVSGVFSTVCVTKMCKCLFHGDLFGRAE